MVAAAWTRDNNERCSRSRHSTGGECRSVQVVAHQNSTCAVHFVHRRCWSRSAIKFDLKLAAQLRGCLRAQPIDSLNAMAAWAAPTASATSMTGSI
jgi:hypothetical protein